MSLLNVKFAGPRLQNTLKILHSAIAKLPDGEIPLQTEIYNAIKGVVYLQDHGATVLNNFFLLKTNEKLAILEKAACEVNHGDVWIVISTAAQIFERRPHSAFIKMGAQNIGFRIIAQNRNERIRII